MGKIEALLARLGAQRVYLDSNVFIYFLDRNPVYFPLVAPLLEAIDGGDIIGVTGDAAVAEVMVRPYQTGDPTLVAGIKSFFGTAGFLSVRSHDAGAFDLAAQLRARHGMKFIDALHAATAISAECRFLITNDGDFGSQVAIEVISLRGLLA
jgi:predicted nucleic acid-binding protein